jgi:hypothetical protein
MLKVRLAVVALAMGLGMAPASASLLITVDKAAQRMIVALDDLPIYDWPVSTGLPGHDTPGGEYRPFRMEKDHYSREWDDAPMPYSIFFTMEGHAIHGSYAVKNLGKPASHGCVRLAPENAAKLFALVKSEKMANTRVVLVGDIPLPAEQNGPRRRQPGFDDYDDFTASLDQPRERGWRSGPLFFEEGPAPERVRPRQESRQETRPEPRRERPLPRYEQGYDQRYDNRRVYRDPGDRRANSDDRRAVPRAYQQERDSFFPFR